MQGDKQKFDQSIIEGPIINAVWKMAWPSIIQNIIAGLQGLIDHALVGHYVGYKANAAIGVGWQIFLVVVVFISSLSVGMSVLVSQAVGAGQTSRVNKIFYQALLTSLVMSCLILAPVGYFLSPYLLTLVKAEDSVRAQALPYLQIMFLFNIGLLFFFMLGGALRAAGDAKTPLKLGLLMTVLTIVLNIILIPGLGPIPALGTAGSAIGTVGSSLLMTSVGIYLLLTKRLAVRLPSGRDLIPDLTIIKSIFSLGLPSGFQGIAMNIGGVILLRFIGTLDHSAETQAAYSVGYSQLFSLITWTSVGLMSASSVMAGQNLGAKKFDRVKQTVATTSKVGLTMAIIIGTLFLIIPSTLLGLFGITDSLVISIGKELLAYLSISGVCITIALTYSGGLQGTGDTRSPLYISLVSQVALPISLCLLIKFLRPLQPSDIWLAIVLGHLARAALTVVKFRQSKWLENPRFAT
ncbi:MAG: MATE family efflux transporter [Acidobacteria bacterium]|nr:MATE family efflux transporter [Acidobacteriota bacterium]